MQIPKMDGGRSRLAYKRGRRKIKCVSYLEVGPTPTEIKPIGQAKSGAK